MSLPHSGTGRNGSVREPERSWLRRAGSAGPSWSNHAVFEATAEQWCAWLGFGSANFSPALIRATPTEKQRQSGWFHFNTDQAVGLYSPQSGARPSQRGDEGRPNPAPPLTAFGQATQAGITVALGLSVLVRNWFREVALLECFDCGCTESAAASGLAGWGRTGGGPMGNGIM
jgi:hypothetical protein